MKLSSCALLFAATMLAGPALAQETPHATAAPVTPVTAKPAKAAEASESTGRDYTIIKLGSEDIKNSEVIDIWKGLFPNGSAPDFNSFDENIRQNVLRGMVSERLIYQEAIKSGFDKNEEVKKRIAAMEKQVVMQSFVGDKAKSLVTENALRAAYAEKTEAAKGQEEIKARHILVPTKEEADKLEDQIKKGTPFEKLAKDRSTDKNSGANGGELGWFTRDKMVPEFADAAFKLKKGEISAPVKSAFGWHIIKVEDRRAVAIPSFEEMKDSLKSEVANKAVQTYVEDLLKKADIKYYGPDGKEKTFSRELNTAQPVAKH